MSDSRSPVPTSPLSAWIGLAAVTILGALVVAWFFSGPPDLSTTDQISRAARAIFALVVASSMAGLAAMATIQFWKVAFRPRAAFHRQELEACLGDRAHELLRLAASGFARDYGDDKRPQTDESPHGSEPGPGGATIPKRESDHLLDSSTEVLLAQLSAAAEFVMIEAHEHRRLLYALAGPVGGNAVEKYLNALETDPADNDGLPSDALFAVRFFVEQNLEDLLLRLRGGWRRRVRLMAAWVAAGVGLVTIILAPVGALAKVSTIAAAGIWGGFFAWFTRDVVALVEQARR